MNNLTLQGQRNACDDTAQGNEDEFNFGLSSPMFAVKSNAPANNVSTAPASAFVNMPVSDELPEMDEEAPEEDDIFIYNAIMCLKCGKGPTEYEADTCHHQLYCKRCAMKFAAEGKCPVCNKVFLTLHHIHPDE